MKKGYIIYMIIILLFAAPILVTPVFLYNHENAFNKMQTLYAFACHQLTSRSYCYFPEKGAVEDCYSSSEYKPNKEAIVEKNGLDGYKFPVCARDLGIYFFMILGGFFVFAISKQEEMVPPSPLWLILALIPIGLDGGTQLLGMRESTNLIRFITGAIAGFVMPFYIVPILNRIFRS